MDVCNFSTAVKFLLLLFASEVSGIGPPNADIVELDVLCDKSGMNVHVSFDRPFQGIVFSKGYFTNPLCRYVAPNSALSSFSFVIPAEGCGTILEETSGRVILDSTLIFQQDPLFQAGWDNVRTLSCDWQAYQGKTVTSSPIGVSAKRPQRAHFSREVVDARLEIRAGGDAFAEGSQLETVHVGDRMTVVVLVSDGGRNYDIRVKNCYAYEDIVSSNSTLKILLLDEEGCPLKPRLLSAFQVTKDTKNTGANIVAYASMFAFRFPHKDQLFLSCGVEVCRNKCPNSCSTIHSTRLPNYPTREPKYIRRTGGFPQSTEVYSAQSEHNISSNRDLNLSSTRRLMKATMNIMASGIRNINRNVSKIELVAQHSNVDTDSNNYEKTELVTPIALEFEGSQDSSERLIFIAKDQNLTSLIREQINEAMHLQKSVDNFVTTVKFDETLHKDDKRSKISNQFINSFSKSLETTNSSFGDKEANSSSEATSGRNFGNISASASHELGILSFDDVVDMEPGNSDNIAKVCVPKFRFYFILGLTVLFIVCLLLTILSLSLCLRRARKKLFAERYLLYRYN